MSDPASAILELEARLSSWVEVKNGVAVFSGARVGKSEYIVHAVPATTPWLLTCGPDGVTVKFTAWAAQDEDSERDPLAKSLTEVALTNEQKIGAQLDANNAPRATSRQCGASQGERRAKPNRVLRHSIDAVRCG